MSNTWVGKSSVTFIFWVPTQEGVEAVRLFFEGHANFMGIKSHQHWALETYSLLYLRRSGVGKRCGILGGKMA